MDNIELLPKSKIIAELESKSKCRADIQLDYIDTLANFKTKVCQEALYINQLFPEYTPHDEPNHLSRLFSLADDILGTTLIDNLNSTELLILSLSLYGHDWGMAVSQEERNLISTNSKKNEDYDFVLLPNDQEEFKRLLKEQGVKEPDNLIWQEYIRNTHARRSQERIIKYFSQINSGLGLAVGKVCHAHALDIERLQDDNDYPVTHTVLQENVNLRAIAIYVRLIDLLDITEWRTPYTIWKYVAPKNSRSKMEWKKHRAVSSIKTAQYENIRSVIVAASTDDHSVYASLLDLKNYCDEQLKGCNALLYRSNNSRYYLNIHEIIWNIDARGFKPISIQFEFDRIKMFEILSDEIYRTDRHVFLRELIQNSIDAIRLRSKILSNRGIPNNIEEIGKIEVSVTDLDNDIVEVSIIDNGVGMDEYIIRNYFSVAGKSYYRSNDFEKLGINLDPISKFGIGVLSSFMVADKIELITTRETYLTKNPITLKINIDSVNTQFKIQEITDSDFLQGTTIKIFVSKSKIKSKVNDGNDWKLYITDYLSIVAAFTEIPIFIDEYGTKTIIISPFNNTNILKEQYPDYEIQTKSIKVNNTDVFSGQSRNESIDHFSQYTIDLSKDLGLKKYNGTITFTIPKKHINLVNNNGAWPVEAYSFRINEKDYNIKFNDEYVRPGIQSRNDELKYGESATCDKRFQVYLKGILVPKTDNSKNRFSDQYQELNSSSNLPFYISRLEEHFFPPIFIVNILDNIKIDVSRSSLILDNKKWDDEISEKLTEFIINKELNQKLTLQDRVIKINTLSVYYRINFNDLVKNYDLLSIPVLYCENNKPILKEWREFLNETIFTQPQNVRLINSFAPDICADIDIVKNLPANNFVFHNFAHDYDDEMISTNLKAFFSTTKNLISNTHTIDSIRFFSSKNKETIIQDRWVPKTKFDIVKENLLSDIISSNTDINTTNISLILSSISLKLGQNAHKVRITSCFVKFENPFKTHFAFNRKYLNINHTFTRSIIKLMCIFANEFDSSNLSHRIKSTIFDAISMIPFLSYQNRNSLEEINENLNIIIDSLKSCNINVDIDRFSIVADDFVPGSVSINGNKIDYNTYSSTKANEYKLMS